MKIISLLSSLKTWNLLLYDVLMIEKIKSKLQYDAQQWILVSYNCLVFDSLSLIHFFIVQDANMHCTRSKILILEVQRKQINQLQMMMIFFTHQHHMIHQKIKHRMISEFHSLSRDSFLREFMSSTASYDINHLSLLIFIQQSIDIMIKILSFSSCMLLLRTIFQKSFHLDLSWMRRRSMIKRLLIIVQRNDSRNITVNWIKSQRLLHFLSCSSLYKTACNDLYEVLAIELSCSKTWRVYLLSLFDHSWTRVLHRTSTSLSACHTKTLKKILLVISSALTRSFWSYWSKRLYVSRSTQSVHVDTIRLRHSSHWKRSSSRTSLSESLYTAVLHAELIQMWQTSYE